MSTPDPLKVAELEKRLAAYDPTVGTLDLKFDTFHLMPADIHWVMPLIESLEGLTTLDLRGNRIGPDGAKAIAESQSLTGLMTLDLQDNGIGRVGAKAIAESQSLTGLTTLNLQENDIRDKAAIAIAKSQSLTGLTTLNLQKNGIGPDGAKAIAESLSLTKLTTLNLGFNKIDDAGAVAIAESQSLKGLTTLNLRGSDIRHKGAIAIAKSQSLTGLTTLDLQGNWIRDIGAIAIAKSQSLTGLTTLNLQYDGIGHVGAKAIAESQSLKGLTTLGLRDSDIRDIGAIAIAKSQSLTGLTTLDLQGNRIGKDGARAMAESLSLTKLTTLNLGFNEIDDAGAVAIAESQSLKGLTTLNLQDNWIRDIGAIAIAKSQSLTGLTTLDLQGNRIGKDGARAMAESLSLTKLTKLHLGSNNIGDAGAVAIAKSHSLKGLTTLDLGFNNIGDAGAVVLLIEALRPGRTKGDPQDGKLEKISVCSNPLKGPDGTSIEVAGLSFDPQPIDDVLAYLNAAMAKDAYVLREARVVLVGVGGNGKSQLAGALGKLFIPPDKATPYTKGLEIVPYDVDIPASEAEQMKTGNETVRYHTRLLDVGGQPEQFSMHRLIFERQRNVMMLVCSAIKPWDWSGNRGSYFLKMLKEVSRQHEKQMPDEREDDQKMMPTVGVITMADFVNGRHTMKTSPKMMRDHAADLGIEMDVVDPAIDAKNQKMQGALAIGLGPVEDAIARAVAKIPETVIPRTFEPVRKKVLDLFGTHEVPNVDVHDCELEWFIYEAQQAGAENRARAMQYLGVMHSLGDVIFFKDNENLNDRVINIHWAREAMYRLLTSDEVRRNRGLLTEADWKQISREERGEKLTKVMIEQGLMHKVEVHDPAQGANTSNWLVPDMMGYATKRHAWTELEPVCRARFKTFLWEATLLQFLGTHAKEVIPQIDHAHRDQAMLQRADGIRILVQADYDSEPMEIRFYKDPTDTTKQSAAWCRVLVNKLPGQTIYPRGQTMKYPHPNADKMLAQQHLHAGIGYYTLQQRTRAYFTKAMIVLVVLSAIASLLLEKFSWVAITLGLLSIASAVAEILVHFFKSKEDRKKCADAFKCVDLILIDGTTHRIYDEQIKLAEVTAKQAPIAAPDDWYVDATEIEKVEVERRKLLAAMQETRFRRTEHRFAMIRAFIIAACCFVLPFFLLFLVSSDKMTPLKAGVVPFSALAIACLLTGLRNLESYWAFNKLHADCVNLHNRYVDGTSDLIELQDAGKSILESVQSLRATKPPVSKYIYDKTRDESNAMCRTYSQLFWGNEKFREND